MASGKDSDRYYINLLPCNDKTTMTIDVVIPDSIALDESIRALGARARRAGEALAQSSDSQKTRALTTIARLVREKPSEHSGSESRGSEKKSRIVALFDGSSGVDSGPG